MKQAHLIFQTNPGNFYLKSVISHKKDMVSFPNAKINIGLNIISKRSDGFHDIETIFYPIKLCDGLEIIPAENPETSINTSGIALNINDSDNICMKAYNLVQSKYPIPPVEMHLLKKIPSGAGLGGGSSNAAFVLKTLNRLFELNLSSKILTELAAKLGSDCAFFIENRAVFAHGRGELFKPVELDLSKYFIYLVKPDVFVSTPQAYGLIKPFRPQKSVSEQIKEPIENWKELITNDFEVKIFELYPILADIKNLMYESGAIYAAMSGSGSSIYGIFEHKPEELKEFSAFFTWISAL
jgi:4-diphosphocytidyl-2-C-methyl-D-erythritol kinase